MNRIIETKPWEEFETDKISKENLTLDWESSNGIGGYYIIVWEKARNEPGNNKILYRVNIPKWLSNLFGSYIENEGYTKRRSLSDL